MIEAIADRVLAVTRRSWFPRLMSLGIAVGDLYTNDATLLDGTPWNFEADALGSVTLVAYFATF